MLNCDYVKQLLEENQRLAAFPNTFQHLNRLLDDEINRVYLHMPGSELIDALNGNYLTKEEKIYLPVREFPECKFVGRILGPKGTIVRQLERDTGCKIMVRGKGTLKGDKLKEASTKKLDLEHLKDELHILIRCSAVADQIDIKIAKAVKEVQKRLLPYQCDNILKHRQTMAIFRGENERNLQISTFVDGAALESFGPARVPLSVQPGAFGSLDSITATFPYVGPVNTSNFGSYSFLADQPHLSSQPLTAVYQSQLAQHADLSCLNHFSAAVTTRGVWFNSQQSVFRQNGIHPYLSGKSFIDLH